MPIPEEEFRQFLTIQKKLAPKSVRTYLQRFRIFIRWLHENNYSVSKEIVEKFLYEKKTSEGLGNSAVNTYIQTLHHMEDFCKDRNKHGHNLPVHFAEDIEGLPKTHPEIIILSQEETERLLSTELNYKDRNSVSCGDLNMRYVTAAWFLALTGARFGEAATLQVKRVDISNGKATLVNTKNRQNRYVYFDGPIKENLSYLVKGRKPDDLVFTNSRGTEIKPGEFNEDLQKRAKKAGITKHVHAHLLRHCFGTELVQSGVDISIAAKLLGHKDIQTTYDTYLHLADKTLQKAAQKHPMMRTYIEPQEVLSMVQAEVNKVIGNDKRFIKDVHINPDTSELNISIKLVQ